PEPLWFKCGQRPEEGFACQPGPGRLQPGESHSPSRRRRPAAGRPVTTNPDTRPFRKSWGRPGGPSRNARTRPPPRAGIPPSLGGVAVPAVLKAGRTATGYLIRVEGHGTLRESDALQRFVRERLGDADTLAVDLADCVCLDSTFLGCLLGLHKRMGTGP